MLISVGLLTTTSACTDSEPEDDSAAPVGTDAPVESTIALEGTDDPVALDAFAVVEDAVAAFNSGDMATWASLRDGSDSTADDYSYDAAADARLTVDRCTYRGVGDWLFDGAVPDGMPGHGFECVGSQTDSFLGLAGVEMEINYNWIVAEDLGSSLGGSNEDFRYLEDLVDDFRSWLQTNDPEAAASIEFNAGRPTAESLPVAIEHFPKYVEATDGLPLEEPLPSATIYGGALRSADG